MRNPFEGHPYRGGANEAEKGEHRREEITQELRGFFDARDKAHRDPSAPMPTASQMNLATQIAKHITVEGRQARIDEISLAKELALSTEETQELIKTFDIRWKGLKQYFLPPSRSPFWMH